MSFDDQQFELAYRIGYGNGYDHGWRQGVDAEQQAWDRIFHTPYLNDWRRPSHAELVERRIPDWQPCRQRCQACSRCVASMAYWARGGKPFTGVGA